MASPAQITANRANAQRSTGPRSVEGKAAASRNSFKFGLTSQAAIVPGEDPAELERLTAAYEADFEPVGPIEAALVQTLVRSLWMQQRCDRLEAAYLSARVAAMPEDAEYPLGQVIAEDAIKGNVLQKIFRRHQAAQREWNTTLNTLNNMQLQRVRYDDELEALTQAEAQAQTAGVPPSASVPNLDWLRFDDPPTVPARRAPEPAANLALRL